MVSAKQSSDDVRYEDSLAMLLRASYTAMRRRAQQRLRGTDATVDQFVIMTLLAEQDGVTQQDLVVRAYSDPSTIRAMLVLLEKRGWLRREQDDTDARARRVFLTKSGRAFQLKLQEIVGSPQAMESSMKPSEFRIVKRCLRKLIDTLRVEE